MNELKEDLKNRYKAKILGIRNYNHSKNEFFVSDFEDLEILEEFLDELDTGESDITPAGKKFLELFYGYKELGSVLAQRGNLKEFTVTSPEEFDIWLSHKEPMEIMRFIETARGNIDENSTLREELMPPADTDCLKST